MNKSTNFKIGQVVNYTVCQSIYTGEIVKVKDSTLIVIGCQSGMKLWEAGCAVGDEITFNQVK